MLHKKAVVSATAFFMKMDRRGRRSLHLARLSVSKDDYVIDMIKKIVGTGVLDGPLFLYEK